MRNTEIYYIDKYVGKLINKLYQNNLIDKTMIIITADHGEAFMEHKVAGHQRELYNELIHVPLIIYHPDLEPTHISFPVGLIDIPTTIVSVLNSPPPDGYLGRNLFDIERNKQRNTV